MVGVVVKSESVNIRTNGENFTFESCFSMITLPWCFTRTHCYWGSMKLEFMDHSLKTFGAGMWRIISKLGSAMLWVSMGFAGFPRAIFKMIKFQSWNIMIIPLTCIKGFNLIFDIYNRTSQTILHTQRPNVCAFSKMYMLNTSTQLVVLGCRGLEIKGRGKL